jgi:hypothetical protein
MVSECHHKVPPFVSLRLGQQPYKFEKKKKKKEWPEIAVQSWWNSEWLWYISGCV